MFLLNLKNNEFFVLLLKNLQYKMFLLNSTANNNASLNVLFTIQNVSIKYIRNNILVKPI